MPSALLVVARQGLVPRFLKLPVRRVWPLPVPGERAALSCSARSFRIPFIGSWRASTVLPDRLRARREGLSPVASDPHQVVCCCSTLGLLTSVCALFQGARYV